MEKISRPRFLNLLQIRFPATAVISVCHRISGVLLLALVPLLLLLLERSLQSADAFQQLLQLWAYLPVRLFVAASCWALLYHLISGVRFLMLDIGLGFNREAAQGSAWLVAGIALLALPPILWMLL